LGATTGGGAAPNDRPGDGGAEPGLSGGPGLAGTVALDDETLGGITVVAGFCSGIRMPGTCGGPGL